MAEFEIPRRAGIRVGIINGDLHISNIDDPDQSMLIVENDAIERFIDLIESVKHHADRSLTESIERDIESGA